MPKDFLQGASLTPTFEALMVKIGGKIGTLYQMLKNAFKKYPPQNRTNVQIKGGGGQRPFEQCSKKLHFFEMGASLSEMPILRPLHLYNEKKTYWGPGSEEEECGGGSVVSCLLQRFTSKYGVVICLKLRRGEEELWSEVYF